MNDQEIIDVQVEEEVLETFVENVVYTDEEIDEMCLQMKQRYESLQTVDEEVMSLARKIARNSKEYLDSNTYLWVMHMYACQFRKDQNINAARYCSMRMRTVLDAESGKKNRPAALTYVENTLPEQVKQDVYADTDFVKDHVKGIKKSFLMLETVILVVFALIMHFLIQTTIPVTLLLTVGLGVFNVFTTYRGLETKFIHNQTIALRSHCECEELEEFDLPVFMS